MASRVFEHIFAKIDEYPKYNWFVQIDLIRISGSDAIFTWKCLMNFFRKILKNCGSYIITPLKEFRPRNSVKSTKCVTRDISPIC